MKIKMQIYIKISSKYLQKWGKWAKLKKYEMSKILVRLRISLAKQNKFTKLKICKIAQSLVFAFCHNKKSYKVT